MKQSLLLLKFQRSRCESTKVNKIPLTATILNKLKKPLILLPSDSVILLRLIESRGSPHRQNGDFRHSPGNNPFFRQSTHLLAASLPRFTVGAKGSYLL